MGDAIDRYVGSLIPTDKNRDNISVAGAAELRSTSDVSSRSRA